MASEKGYCRQHYFGKHRDYLCDSSLDIKFIEEQSYYGAKTHLLVMSALVKLYAILFL